MAAPAPPHTRRGGYGTAIERDFNVLDDQAASRPVEHWNLSDAHHADA